MRPLSLKRKHDCLVIAEVAQAHDGNINIAHAFIDAVAKTGANAIKFQTHIAEEESTKDEKWRVKFSFQDASRYDYWKRMEFSEDQWLELKRHAEELGLYFLSSPFSVKAIQMLERIGVPGWKIGSGEVLSTSMLDEMVSTRKPIICSSGMSDYQELDQLVTRFQADQIEFALMQCTTAYPTQMNQIGLNVVSEFQQRYECPVGLSDHSGKIWPSIAAVSLGAELVEIHVTMSREMFGPDVSSSITINELSNLVEGVHSVNSMQKNKLDKSVLTADQTKMRRLFMKSLVANADLYEGTVLGHEHISEKKPASGLPPVQKQLFVGQKLLKNINKDEMFTWDHIGAGPKL